MHLPTEGPIQVVHWSFRQLANNHSVTGVIEISLQPELFTSAKSMKLLVFPESIKLWILLSFKGVYDLQYLVLMWTLDSKIHT